MFKKGQIETFGLVIIVLLVVFIGLFALLFSRSGGDDRNVYLNNKAYNFANALAKADVSGTNFGDLATSCCLGEEVDCNTLRNFVSGNMNFVDEDSGFVMECSGGEEIRVGDCFLGINSESFRRSGKFEFYVVICEK